MPDTVSKGVWSTPSNGTPMAAASRALRLNACNFRSFRSLARLASCFGSAGGSVVVGLRCVGIVRPLYRFRTPAAGDGTSID